MSNSNINGKKNESVLGLTPMQPQSTSSLGLAPLGPINPPQYPANRAISKHERQILDTCHEEVLIIDATEAKAEFGMYKLGQLQERASELFGDTISFMMQNKEEAKGTEAEPYIAEFTRRQIHIYARHMLGALEVTGTRIGEEMHRSLNVPPEEKGFWARVLGK
jgi:hypothetical protein